MSPIDVLTFRRPRWAATPAGSALAQDFRNRQILMDQLSWRPGCAAGRAITSRDLSRKSVRVGGAEGHRHCLPIRLGFVIIRTPLGLTAVGNASP